VEFIFLNMESVENKTNITDIVKIIIGRAFYDQPTYLS